MFWTCIRADSRFSHSQWETVLLCNDVSHWLAANQVSHVCVWTHWGLHRMVMVSTHWGRVTHICVSKLIIIGSGNGLSPGRRQAINNTAISLIEPSRTKFAEIFNETRTLSFKKVHLKRSSAKWRPFCLGFNWIAQGRAVEINDFVTLCAKPMGISTHIYIVTKVHRHQTSRIHFTRWVRVTHICGSKLNHLRSESGF